MAEKSAATQAEERFMVIRRTTKEWLDRAVRRQCPAAKMNAAQRSESVAYWQGLVEYALEVAGETAAVLELAEREIKRLNGK